MRLLFSLSATAVCAVSLGLCAPSLASPAGGASGGASDARTVASNPNFSNPNFAGYVYQATNYRKFTVTTTIMVPKLKCTSSTERAIDASVGMGSRAGAALTSAGLFVGCYQDKAYYYPSLEINGSNHNYPKHEAKPGDQVVLSASESAKGTSVSVTDVTHKFKQSLKGGGSNELSNPWVGDVGWYNPGLLAVPDFGSLHFANSKLDGKAFGSWGKGSGSTPVRENRASGGTTQIATTALATNREAFTTTFKHS